MIKWSFVLILLALCLIGFGQRENHTWLSGYQNINFDTTVVDTGIYKTFGGTIINFNQTPKKITRTTKSLSVRSLVINYCDTNGNLLFYSNGSKVFNASHRLIENGDSLNYSLDWIVNKDDTGYYANHTISIWRQSMIAIRSPSNPNQYYLVATYLDWGSHHPDYRAFTKIMYSVLDMSLNEGKGKLILKEKILDTGNYNEGVYACKQANGRDWWLYVHEMTGTNCFRKMVLDSQGIRLLSNRECIGYTQSSTEFLGIVPNSQTGCFSEDGNHFAYHSNKGIEVFDFNRCTGIFFNRKFKDYPLNDSFTTRGLHGFTSVIFSPNSRYVYAVEALRIYQFDIKAPDFVNSQKLVAVYDGFEDHYREDPNVIGVPTYFYASTLAPDGKIYLGNSTRYVSYIDSPDMAGIRCSVRQHAIKLESYWGGPPYHPTYGLGREKCCAYPITKSLYRSDTHIYTLDTGRYQWLACESSYAPIAGATASSYKPRQSGYYALRIQTAFCDDTTDCIFYLAPPPCTPPNTALARTDTSILCIEGNASSYQWLYCDSPMSGSYQPIPQATGRFYTPKISARYACLITKDGCTDTTDCYYFDIPIVGIIDHSSTVIVVYPNPASKFIFIESSSNKGLSVEIYNLLGQKIYTQENKKRIDISHTPNGIYILKILDEEGIETHRERLIIEN